MLGRLRSYRRRDDGIVAVEFALLAIPLVTLIMGIVETALFFSAGVVLEGASADAARLIRTGQIQDLADPEQAFKDELCAKAQPLLDCTKLQYEVILVQPNTFTGAEAYMPAFDANGNLIPLGFNTGNSNDIVMVRAAYKYQFMVPFIGALMTGDINRTWINHVATVVIKSEPYKFGEQ